MLASAAERMSLQSGERSSQPASVVRTTFDYLPTGCQRCAPHRLRPMGARSAAVEGAPGAWRPADGRIQLLARIAKDSRGEFVRAYACIADSKYNSHVELPERRRTL